MKAEEQNDGRPAEAIEVEFLPGNNMALEGQGALALCNDGIVLWGTRRAGAVRFMAGLGGLLFAGVLAPILHRRTGMRDVCLRFPAREVRGAQVAREGDEARLLFRAGPKWYALGSRRPAEFDLKVRIAPMRLAVLLNRAGIELKDKKLARLIGERDRAAREGRWSSPPSWPGL